jgi:hypothetical protein
VAVDASLIVPRQDGRQQIRVLGRHPDFLEQLINQLFQIVVGNPYPMIRRIVSSFKIHDSIVYWTSCLRRQASSALYPVPDEGTGFPRSRE